VSVEWPGRDRTADSHHRWVHDVMDRSWAGDFVDKIWAHCTEAKPITPGA